MQHNAMTQHRNQQYAQPKKQAKEPCNYAGGTANIKRWHFGGHKSIKKKADMILIYNGSTHFPGTGNFYHKL